MSVWNNEKDIPPLQDEINSDFAGRLITGIICALFGACIDTGLVLWVNVKGSVILLAVIIGISFIGGFIGGQRFLDILRRIVNKVD